MQELVRSTVEKLSRLRYESWTTSTFLTWRFWVLLAVLIVPWLFLLKFIDKRQLLKTSFFGVVIALISVILDEIGVNLAFWEYPNDLEPVIPTFISGAFGFFPAILMLIYQKFDRVGWHFYAATIFFAAVVAFIGQPILTKYNFYTLYHWRYYASFLTIIFMSATARAVTNWLLKRSERLF